MDSIFATPGNWHSAEQYKQLMGERLSELLACSAAAVNVATLAAVCFLAVANDLWCTHCENVSFESRREHVLLQTLQLT
jgi:hypothetical protein